MEDRTKDIVNGILQMLSEEEIGTSVMGNLFDPFTLQPTIAIMDKSDPSGEERLRYMINIIDVTKADEERLRYTINTIDPTKVDENGKN